MSKIALGFENQDTLTSSGITLASVRYIYLSGTDKVIRAKQGKVGAHCVKTQQSKLYLIVVLTYFISLLVLKHNGTYLCT